MPTVSPDVLKFNFGITVTFRNFNGF
jgi:hypothetical protein